MASPAAGTYDTAQDVTLTSTGADTILYSLSATVPACPATGTVYTTPVTVAGTIKAIACDNNGNSSAVLTATYVTTSNGSSTTGSSGGSAAYGQPACSGTDCTGGTSSSNSGTTSGSSTSGSTSGTTQNFTDISGHWAQDYINQLYNLGITGYVDANGNLLHIFKPDNNISRAELMVMLMKVKYGNLDAVSSAPFSDVAADHWAAPYIAKAKSLGIVDGYSDGTFKPDSSANRAEALKMILLTWFPQDQVDAAVAQTSCSDVKSSDWFAGYFNFALEKGVVSGYKDASGNATGLCGPANDVTRAESAKMIVGTNGL